MPRNPPPEQPVRTYPSPDITDQVVIEFVTSELAASAPVAPGTAHPNTRDFSGFKFAKQVVNPADHNFFIRYYVKDQPSPDTFTPAWNYALKYSGQANSYPVVIRSYRKLKSGYAPLTKGTALSDFAGAYLVEEEALQFPADSEFYAQYFNVVRVYETLPGPYIPFTRYDENLGPIQGRRRAVLNSGQVTTLGATSKQTYEGRDGSSIVSWEIEESWSDGTGGAGNPAYPILKADFNDPERGPVHQVSQITTDTTSAGSSTVSGGTATNTRYEPYQDNPNLRKKIVETWSVPRTLSGQELTTQFGGGALDVTRTRDDEGAQTLDEGLVVVESKIESLGTGEESKVTKSLQDDHWPTLLETEFDARFGVLTQIDKQVVAAGTLGSVGSLSVTEVRAHDKWRSLQLIGSIPELPDDQLWYGTRNHSFPDELLDFDLVGTEEMNVEFNIRDGYSGPCKARFTRSFSEGPPTAEPEPTIFLPQAFYKYIEYQTSRSSSNTSSSTSQGTSDHSATSQSTSESSGTHSSTSASDSTSTSSGTSSNTDISSSNGTESGTSSVTNNSTNQGTSSGTANSSGNGTSGSTNSSHNYSETFVTADVIGGNPGGFTTSESDSIGESSGTNEGTQNTTSSNETTSENSGTSDSIHQGTSQSNRTSSSQGTSSGTSQNSSTGNSSGTSQSTSSESGSSSGSSQSNNTNEGTSETTSTGLSSLRISIPKTLRPAMSASNMGVTVEIPATSPTELPHGEWIVVDSQSDHWKFGVWVTETIEILVP